MVGGFVDQDEGEAGARRLAFRHPEDLSQKYRQKSGPSLVPVRNCLSLEEGCPGAAMT